MDEVEWLGAGDDAATMTVVVWYPPDANGDVLASVSHGSFADGDGTWSSTIVVGVW